MEQLSIRNGNGAVAGNNGAAMEMGLAEKTLARRDEKKTALRRVRRVLRKTGRDLHYRNGEYFLTSIFPYDAIDIEAFARRIGATIPVGACGFCKGIAWHNIDGINVCDSCERQVRQ
jgi:hypothetical protein